MGAADVLQALYGRFTAGDLDGFRALCDPDLEFVAWPGNEMMAFSGLYRGVDALLTRIGDLQETFEYHRFEPIEVFGTDDKAAGRVAVAMTVKKNNITVEAEIAHIATVRDGKLVSIHEYFDSDRFGRAMA